MPRKFSLDPNAVDRTKSYTIDQFCEVVNIKRRTLSMWRQRWAFPIRDVGLIVGEDVHNWLLSRPLKAQRMSEGFRGKRLPKKSKSKAARAASAAN